MDKELQKLLEKLAELKDLSQEELDLLKKHTAKQEAEAEEAQKEKRPVRRIAFSDESPSLVRNIREIVKLPARLLTEEEKRVQEVNDNLYILSRVLKTDPRQLKSWETFAPSGSALRKALDTATSGEGAEWVPTGLSANYIEKFRLESKVAGLFMDVPMPTNPWEVPYISGSIDFYLMPESTSDEPSKTPASTPGTGKRTMTAKKLRARVLFSEELDEQSVVPLLPALQEEITMAGAETLDDVIINGDTTATHQDSDVTDSKDKRKSWNGLRKLCPAGTKKDLSTFDKDTVRSLKTALGKFGTKPNSLAWLASITSADKLTGLAEVLTVDKYGPNATIHTGEIGKIYGAPIITSEKIREDLNATGVYDGTTTSYTLLMILHKRAFMLGSYKPITLNTYFDQDVDQYVLNVKFKKAFIDRWDTSVAANTTVALGYKIS